MKLDIGSYYEMVEPESGQPDQYFWHFKVIEGQYEGAILKFDTVKFDELPGDKLGYSFTYTMINDPFGLDTSPNSEFTIFVSKILEHFLVNHYDDMISGTTRKENLKKK